MKTRILRVKGSSLTMSKAVELGSQWLGSSHVQTGCWCSWALGSYGLATGGCSMAWVLYRASFATTIFTG